MRIEQFKSRHLDLIDLQKEQGFFKPFIVDKRYREFLGGCIGYSLLSNDGLDCFACGGIADKGNKKAEAWAFLGASSGKYLFRITKFVKSFIEKSDYNEIEINVKADFDQGIRWAKLLGFDINKETNIMIGNEKHYKFTRQQL